MQSDSCAYLLSGVFKDLKEGKSSIFPGSEQKRACLVCEMVVGDTVLIPAAQEEIAFASQCDLVSFLQ